MYCHFAPPCGTCSRAREIRLRDVPGGGPPPLKSDSYPLGSPNLASDYPKEYPRVQTASELYSFMAKCIPTLMDRSIALSIKNPAISLLWQIPDVKSIMDKADIDMVTLQHCAYGGERPKRIGFLHFPGGFLRELRAVCPGISDTHKHAA